MDLILIGGAIGVFATLVMDLLNLSFARIELIPKIDIKMIGRMGAGWARGRFCYNHPSEMKKIANEVLWGYVTHYSIGLGLVIPYIYIWDQIFEGPPSPLWALAYGISTTVASYFFVYPSMGFGIFGRRSPEGIRAALSSFANHLFFGIGIAAGIALT